MWSTQESPDEAWKRLCGEGGIALADLPKLGEGEAYSVTVPGAGPIAGKAIFSAGDREFSGSAANLGDGWFRVHCEHWAGATQIWLWLALYEGTAEQAATYERAFDAVLGGMFADGRKAAGANA